MENTAVQEKTEVDLLSYRQEALLDAIIAYKDKHDGCAPSIRELVIATDITSTSVVSYHLSRLELKGYIRRQPGVSRTIEVLSA
jgi:repressor LexA